MGWRECKSDTRQREEYEQLQSTRRVPGGFQKREEICGGSEKLGEEDMLRSDCERETTCTYYLY